PVWVIGGPVLRGSHWFSLSGLGHEWGKFSFKMDVLGFGSSERPPSFAERIGLYEDLWNAVKGLGFQKLQIRDLTRPNMVMTWYYGTLSGLSDELQLQPMSVQALEPLAYLTKLSEVILALRDFQARMRKERQELVDTHVNDALRRLDSLARQATDVSDDEVR